MINIRQSYKYVGSFALIGFASYGSYSDLAIWSGWCLINAILALLSIVLNKKKK